MTDTKNTRLIRMKEVCTITGLSRSSIYLYVAKGVFPKPLKLGGKAIAWRWNEVAAWLESRPVAQGKSYE